VKTGRFITLEGGEGAGKSEQAARLAAWLREEGHDVLVTREPGGSPNAEALREMLLSGRFAERGAETEALAFALARVDHLAVAIRPALAAGTWVVCDRFIDSTRAYQGTAGADPALLDLLERIAVGDDRPDLTVILDLPAALGLERARRAKPVPDRFESDALPLHEARRRAFLTIAEREPARCVVVDASADIAGVATAIRAAVTGRLLSVSGARD
jgi:dTMP kinase